MIAPRLARPVLRRHRRVQRGPLNGSGFSQRSAFTAGSSCLGGERAPASSATDGSRKRMSCGSATGKAWPSVRAATRAGNRPGGGAARVEPWFTGCRRSVPLKSPSGPLAMPTAGECASVDDPLTNLVIHGGRPALGAQAGGRDAAGRGLDPRLFGGGYPHEVSGGQRQRGNIARAGVRPPPGRARRARLRARQSGLAHVLTLLQQLKAASRLTYVLISHDLNVIEYASDRHFAACHLYADATERSAPSPRGHR
jgi:hypothetical protein